MDKKNQRPRYRLQPHTAKLLGLDVKPHYNKYTLTPEQEKRYFEEIKTEPIKRLFFDIETSRMVFEVKDWAVRREKRMSYEDVVKESKIICISYMWEHEGIVRNLRWDKNLCDKKMLIDFNRIINEADEVVGHNGDNFDIKITRTRSLYHRIPFRINIRSLDTLKKARRYFRFPNNKLDTIAKFFGVGAKIEHEGIKMWDKVEDGDKQALIDMVKYCDMDVVVLSDVYFVMQNYVKHNSHAGVLTGGYKHECPSCGGNNSTLLKNNFTAAGTIKRLMECNNCGYDYEISNTAYRHMLEMQSNLNPVL